MTPELASLMAKKIHVDDSLPGQPPKEPPPLHEWGDLPFWVSAFDHRLSQEEYVAALFVNFPGAVHHGALADYLEGERGLEAYYAELAREGAYVWQGERRGFRFMPASSGRLSRIIRDSLRERRSMDIYFVATPVRVIGGWNRTDAILPASEAVRETAAAAARRHGVFVLT
ncbi:hypothetical protein SGCZBJ_24985 [Caulobacter zeae]|uniref:Uncharacterized protein n=1 Tax=Caulobacter zeae TaxID=2055137 RepID=A0A2N5CYL6_9CAUL|nr:hypothetical protein [Caulobacter zeae]PLR18891.1 hypothetical protein SGCZBJ_24985 [Caulobacter zeae]